MRDKENKVSTQSSVTMQSLGLFLTDTIAAAPQKRVTVCSLMERYEVNSVLGVAQNLTPKLSVTCIAASS